MVVVGMVLMVVGFIRIVPKGALFGSIRNALETDTQESSDTDQSGTFWERRGARIKRVAIGLTMMAIGLALIEFSGV
jgi:hypothetical protein